MTDKNETTVVSDGNYHLVPINNKSDDEEDQKYLQRTGNHTASTLNEEKTSEHITRNGLVKKQFLFLHKSSCEFSSVETKTPPSSQYLVHEPPPASVICANTFRRESSSIHPVKKNRQSIDGSNATPMNGTKSAHELTRTDQVHSTGKKQVLLNHHLGIRSNFHRRQRRFIIACGTVLLALTIIATIIVYVVITTVRYQTQGRESSLNKPN